MKLSDAIKEKALTNGTLIQSTIEADIMKLFNKLFYADRNIEEETKFIKQVMTRGTDNKERVGLHASAIIVGDKEFCVREQVLSLLYKQLQGENVPINLKRIFEEGNAIHEKWQRLFIRGGLGKAEDMDFTRFNKKYEISFTPDAIITIDGEKYVVEIKSVNTYQFKGMTEHPSGAKQLKFYMRLTGIHKGIVLLDDKNTQEFKIKVYEYDEEADKLTAHFVERLEAIQYYKQRILEEGKIPKRHPECITYSAKRCSKCNMRDVCFGKSRVRLNV